jgi:hypothetical protein
MYHDPGLFLSWPQRGRKFPGPVPLPQPARCLLASIFRCSHRSSQGSSSMARWKVVRPPWERSAAVSW